MHQKYRGDVIYDVQTRHRNILGIGGPGATERDGGLRDCRGCNGSKESGRTSRLAFRYSHCVFDYDSAIDWLSRCLDFRVHEVTATERKRWVTMTPSGGGCLFVLSRVKNTAHSEGVGNQFAGRVGFFLYTDNFDRAEDRLRQNQVQIVREPEDSPRLPRPVGQPVGLD